MTCNHDEPPIKETLRAHMIRAHGCTEAHVRWVIFFRAFGVGVESAHKNRDAGFLLQPGDLDLLLSYMSPESAAGFRLGFEQGAAWERVGDES